MAGFLSLDVIPDINLRDSGDLHEFARSGQTFRTRDPQPRASKQLGQLARSQGAGGRI